VIVGIITRSGLMSIQGALDLAYDQGHVDQYPYIILESMLKSYRPKGATASMVSGGSFRQQVLKALVDYYINPKDHIAMTRGTLIHGGVELVKTDRAAIRERRLKAELPNYGEVQVSGQIDLYYPNRNRLEDIKTAKIIPSHIPDYHLFQLAVYKWLLCWNGYQVDTVAILYISWDSIFYVDTTMHEGKPIKAINHPLLQYEQMFEWEFYYGWEIITRGTKERIVPSTQQCNLHWCRSCPVKWACDRIDPHGGQINPAEFDQRELY
jgi:hypothetical protein